MISLAMWLDKLPEDKAKYYNKTRMSMELFSYKLHLSSRGIIEELRKNGYSYNAAARIFELIEK